jgi:nitrogen-specific signal transduction histidine kinase
MIVSGVILLAVLEGFLLLNNYNKKRAEKIITTAEFYDNYCRLIAIIDEADSIEGDVIQIELFNDGKQCYEMRVNQDSFLIVSRNFISDTLFRRIIKLANMKDALLLEMLNNNDSLLQLKLAIVSDKHKVIQQTIENREKEYEYE